MPAPIADPVPEDVAAFFRGRRAAVTGGAGTVGREVVRQLLAAGVEIVRVLDNNEGELFALANGAAAADARLQCFLCDVRAEHELHRMFRDMDFIIHAAALKNLDLCERAPAMVIESNIIGVQNVIRAATASGVERLLFTSSDKAVNPTSVMGTSKLMGERLITAANATALGGDGMISTSTRFGNVAGSRGSVIPLFCRQIADGARVTLTDPEMTRFVMPLAAAAGLCLRALRLACGGEVFVTKMPVLRIEDLAHVMIRLLAPLYGRTPGDYEIAIVGPRPGEKLWEELTTQEELRRTVEHGGFYVVLPPFEDVYGRTRYAYDGARPPAATRLYVSSNEPTMSEDEIGDFLLVPGVLPGDVRRRLAATRRESCES